MKVFIGFVFILLIGISGYIGYQYLSHQAASPQTTTSTAVTATGKLLSGKGDDYSYVLLVNGKTIGVTSQTIQLEKYANKNIEVTGSYSGTTLYAVTVVEIK